MRYGAAAIASALFLVASGAQAQNLRPNAPESGRHGQGGARRDQLEREFRQRGEQVVRERLNLNNDQVRQLREVNRGLSGRRNALLQQERSVRTALRDETAKGPSADQSRVAGLMNQARDLQNQRFALQQEEGQQLSAFLTPVQVAQYYGLQAQLRERLRELRTQEQGNPGAVIP